MNKVKLLFSRFNCEFILMAIIGCLIFSFVQVLAQPLALGKSKFLGSCVGNNIRSNFANYWNQVTTENAGKWASVEGSKDQYNWTPLDNIYNYAIARGFPYKHHALVWGSQYPSWITSLDSANQRAQIEEWIRLVGQRYPQMNFVDVVNEPFTTTVPFKNALGGNGTTGWDWVITAFRWARQYCAPGVKLILNEYNILQSNTVTDNYLRLIDTLKVRGLIDGIGIQGHYFEFKGSNYTYPLSTLRYNLDRLAAKGLPIYISEFDINEPDDNVQLENYKTYFPLFWENPGVKGITLWGYVQYDIWKVNAYLMTDRYVERPALQWLRTYITSTDVDEFNETIPTDYFLNQNYPNPFNPETVISYQLPVDGNVSLKVFDLMGREVATLVNEYQQAGIHNSKFSILNPTAGRQGSQFSSGVYFYTINAGNFIQTKKMILVK